MCWLFTVLDLPHSPEHTVHNREWISVPVRDSCCIPVSVFARTFHWQLSYKHKLFFLNSNKMPVKHKHNGIVTFTQFPRASLQRKQTEAVALTRSCHTFSTPLSIENSYSTVSFSAAMNRGYSMHLYFCLCVCVYVRVPLLSLTLYAVECLVDAQRPASATVQESCWRAATAAECMIN